MNIITFGNNKTVPVCKIDLVELLTDKYESKVSIHLGSKEIKVTFKDYEDALKLYNEIREVLKETHPGYTELHRANI